MKADRASLPDPTDEELTRVARPFLPLLREVQGLPVALWLRMAQDEFGRSGDVTYAHIVRSLCVTAGRQEPEWATRALVEQSHAICAAALSDGLDRRLPKTNAVKRAVRDFRLAHQIHKTTNTLGVSRKTAFKAVTKFLPANAHGSRISEQTPKRAWRRYASKRSFDQLYRDK